MAIAKNLEELLKHMDPTAAESQRKFWDANPAIAETVDRMTVPQAEFSRQLNAKEERAKAAEKFSAEWKSWSDKNVPIHKRAIEDIDRLEQEKADLTRQVQEASSRTSSSTGIDVDEDKLMDNVLRKIEGRTVSPDKLAELVQAEASKLAAKTNELVQAARKDFLENTFPATTNFQADLLEVMQDYKDEFGKKLPRKEFSEFMQEKGIFSPREAFDRFTDTSRREREVKTEVEKRVQEELGKRNLPGVTPGQNVSSDIGPLQLRIAGEAPKFPDNSELGDRTAASMAANEMRKEGLF